MATDRTWTDPDPRHLQPLSEALERVRISPETLAHHLEVVALHYAENAEGIALPRIAEQFQAQATEARKWAAMFRET